MIDDRMVAEGKSEPRWFHQPGFVEEQTIDLQAPEPDFAYAGRERHESILEILERSGVLVGNSEPIFRGDDLGRA